MSTRRALLLAAIVACATPMAHAERADREKEIVVLADRAFGDDKNQVRTLEGNVVITQGTMRITAAKVTLHEKDKFNYYVASGSPVTFREKRDKVDEWVEGTAERAEYDDRNEVLKLFNRAKVKGAKSEVTGELITYDTRREVVEVTGAPPGQKVPEEKQRVKVIIVPQKGGNAPKADAKDGAKLKPETEMK